MAEFQWRGRHKDEEKGNQSIARMKGVQEALAQVAVTIHDRADRALTAVQHSPNYTGSKETSLRIARGDSTDYFVRLEGPDARHVEYGNPGYIDPDTGETYGATEPKYILTNAARLPRRAKVTKTIRKRARKVNRTTKED